MFLSGLVSKSYHASKGQDAILNLSKKLGIFSPLYHPQRYVHRDFERMNCTCRGGGVFNPGLMHKLIAKQSE